MGATELLATQELEYRKEKVARFFAPATYLADRQKTIDQGGWRGKYLAEELARGVEVMEMSVTVTLRIPTSALIRSQLCDSVHQSVYAALPELEAELIRQLVTQRPEVAEEVKRHIVLGAKLHGMYEFLNGIPPESPHYFKTELFNLDEARHIVDERERIELKLVGESRSKEDRKRLLPLFERLQDEESVQHGKI